MAVMSSSVTRPVRSPVGGVAHRALPLAGYTNFGGGSTAHTVYKGSVVICDVSDTDGYFRACPLVSSTNLTTSDVIGGVAVEEQSVTSDNTDDGSVKVTVAINGVWGFAVGSLAITDIGAPAYASDDQTITTTSTNAAWIGTIVDVDSTYVWVDISRAAGQLNSAT